MENFWEKLDLKGNPRGVAYLNDDEILIVDTNNDRIQQTDIQTATGKEGLGIGDFDIQVMFVWMKNVALLWPGLGIVGDRWCHEFGKKAIKMDNLTTRVVCL